MSAMSVEMILRLIDQFTGPAKQAEVELERVKTAAEKLNQTRAGGSGGGAGGGRGPGGMRAAEWLEQQRALETHRKQLEAYEAQVKRVEEAQRAMVDSFLAAKLAHGSTDLVKDAFKAGTEGAHVEVSLAASGASPEEIKDIQERAAELSRQFRLFSKSSVENMIGDAKSFAGSLEHAYEVMPELLKLRTIQQGMHGTSSDKEFGYLTKAFEQGGVIADHEKTRQRAETFAKWMEVYRETMSVDAINEFYQGLKGPIARSLSEDFLRGAAGHFIQELGGHQAGNAFSQMYMAIVASRAQPRALAALKELGLLDKDKITEGGPFGVRAAEPGAVQGWRLFATNPDQWVRSVLGPALEKLAPEKREELESALFSDATARNIADKLLHQQPTIDKDASLVRAAPGLGAADTWLKDPRVAMGQASAQFENLARDAGKWPAEIGGAAMKLIAGMEAAAGALTEKHPAAATVGGAALAGAGMGAAWWLTQAAALKLQSWWGNGAPKPPTPPAAPAAPASPAIPKPTPEMIADAESTVWKALGGQEHALSVAGKIGRGIRGGLIGGVVGAGAEWLLQKGEEKAFGWTEESYTKNRERIHAKASEWWGQLLGGQQPPAGLPQGRTLPTFAGFDLSALAGAQSVAKGVEDALKGVSEIHAAPQIDTAQLDAGAAKAREVGDEMRAALEVRATPQIDLSGLERALSLAKQVHAELSNLGVAAHAAGPAAAGLHVLHDGPEAH